MTHGKEKRKCHRFTIPGGKGKYKKAGFIGLIKGFSDLCHVLNLSKGGVAFRTEKELRQGEKLIFQLLIPEETPLIVHSFVRRQEHSAIGKLKRVGITFLPFNNRKNGNSVKTLHVLRKLDEEYGSNNYT